jgi:putative ABC transport system substrate-binding protein
VAARGAGAAAGHAGRRIAPQHDGRAVRGFVEGRNVAIEQRWADNQLDRLPDLAVDLLHKNATVIVANTPALKAVRAASSTVPIIFVVGDDPVKMGSLAVSTDQRATSRA